MAFAELSDEQLIHKMLGTERELLTSRFQHSQNQLENTSHLRGLRRSVARLLTEARQREIAGGLGKDSLLSAHRGAFATQTSDGSAAEEEGGFLQGIVDKLTSND